MLESTKARATPSAWDYIRRVVVTAGPVTTALETRHGHSGVARLPSRLGGVTISCNSRLLRQNAQAPEPAWQCDLPDGRYVAFVANSDGKDHLWLRPLNARTARMLEDTEDAQFPFWSPDSSSIGFFAGTKLKRFDLNGVGTRTSPRRRTAAEERGAAMA